MPTLGPVGTVLLGIALSAASSYLVYVLTPRPKLLAQGAESLLRTSRGSILPWRAIYGTTRVGGALVFQHDAADYVWQVIVIACHEVEEITQLWANDAQVTLGSWTAMTGTDNYADGTGTWTKVRVYRHHGSATQVVSPELDTASGLWGTNNKLLGRAYIVLRLDKDANKWPNGLPNWSVVVKGKKVLDTRTGLVAWSANPALCMADYLNNASYGLGAGTISGGIYTEVEDAVLTTAANVCEEAVNILPSGTEDRYTLNGAFDVDATHEDILARMLTSMAGTLVYAEGKWHVHAGAHTASVQTITEDDIIAPVKVTPRLSRSELFNRVKGIYVNPANKYLPSDYPIIDNATYATEDGESLTLDHDLPFTASASTAQRLAKIELETCRQQISVALKCKLTCLQLRPPDRVALTLSRFGWSAKLFRVVESSIEHETDPTGSPLVYVALALRETSATLYDWDETTEETTVDAAPDTTLDDPLTIDDPTGLTLTDIETETDDGRKRTYVRVQWTAVADPKLLRYEVSWKSAVTNWPTTGYQTFPVEPVASPEAMVGPISDGFTATVRVRAVAINGPVSAWVSDTIDIDPDESDFIGRFGGRNYGTRPLVRARQSGTAKDGDAVVFAQPFEATPDVKIDPTNAKLFHYEPSSGQPLYQQDQAGRFEALDVTPTGFTVAAKLAGTVGTTTGRTATFSGTDAVKSETPEAFDDKYTFQYDVVLQAALEKPSGAIRSSYVYLSFWARPSAGTWLQYGPQEYFENGDTGSSATFTNVTKQIIVDGQAQNAEFRIQVDSSFRLTSVTRDNVTWMEATAPDEVSATPGDNHYVTWTAELTV